MSKILVLGGTSFIGRNILDELKDKYDLVVPTRIDLDLLKDDLLPFIKEYEPDVLLFMAWDKDNKTNLIIYDNVMKYAKKFQKIIYLGSGAEYDKTRSLDMIKEEDAGRYIPTDDYGLTKYIIYTQNKKLDNVIHLRLFGVYGKKELPTRFISYAINCVKNNKPIEIKNNCLFSYITVEDLGDIIDLMISRDTKYKVYNITPDKPVAIDHIAKLVIELMNKEVPIKYLGNGLNYTGSNKRLQSEFHFKFTQLEEGIKKMYEKF